MNTILTIIASIVASIWAIGIIMHFLLFSFLPRIYKEIAMAMAGDFIDEKKIDADVEKMKKDLAWTMRDVVDIVFWPIMLPLSIYESMKISKKTENDKENK